jgi:spermidine/putrescine transport system permease protein
MPASPRSPKAERSAWLLIAPGLGWLLALFVLPLAALLPMSLAEQRNRFSLAVAFTGRIANYGEVIAAHGPTLLRSLAYALAATLVALLLAYPLAWQIRFRGGRWKPLLMGLVVVPFFTATLVRTIAWTTLLGDEGPLITAIRAVGLTGALEALGLLHDGRLLNTPAAVIGGLATNALPFLVLPIVVSMERIGPELLAAAGDLHAGPWTTFRRVVGPLSLPGVGAGLVLSLIPAAGDVVNPRFLGGPNDRMIGNVVENLMLVQRQLPKAAALAVVLMALMGTGLIAYVRQRGSEDLTLP